MAEESKDEPRGFTVVDRRHGRESAEERSGTEPAGGSEEAARREPPRSAPPPPGSGVERPEQSERPRAADAEEPRPGSRGPGPAGPLPGIDFATFLLSLSTSALHHMGLVAEREGVPPPPPNLPMARQTIDILEILQEKTRGNLDAEEAHLLEGLLYELRMRFVEVQEKGR